MLSRSVRNCSENKICTRFSCLDSFDPHVSAHSFFAEHVDFSALISLILNASLLCYTSGQKCRGKAFFPQPMPANCSTGGELPYEKYTFTSSVFQQHDCRIQLFYCYYMPQAAENTSSSISVCCVMRRTMAVFLWNPLRNFLIILSGTSTAACSTGQTRD